MRPVGHTVVEITSLIKQKSRSLSRHPRTDTRAKKAIGAFGILDNHDGALARDDFGGLVLTRPPLVPESPPPGYGFPSAGGDIVRTDNDGSLQPNPAASVPERTRSLSFAVLAAGGVALGMHLIVGAAYALTLVLAPLWVSVVMALWWLVQLLVGLVLLARRSLLVLAVPVVAIGSWAALIDAGRTWFGWH